MHDKRGKNVELTVTELLSYGTVRIECTDVNNQETAGTGYVVEFEKDGDTNISITALITKLVSCRAAGGVTVPSWRQQAAPAPSPILPKVTPGGDPRDGFDPDAIIARHLAEREQIVAVTRPDLQSDQSPRKGFGRKVSR